jgi:hypothetical protein
MPVAVRCFLAVVAGFLTMAVVVTVCTTAAVKLLGVQAGKPSPGYLALNVAYSLGAAALGGWVAAMIGRPYAVESGYALGGVMILMGLLSYRQFRGMQPLWYQILLMFLPAVVAIITARAVGAPQ